MRPEPGTASAGSPCGGGSKPSVDAIRFHTTGYAAQGEPRPGKARVWHTPRGDSLGVYFFPVPPDLPANAAPVDELATFYGPTLENPEHARSLRCALRPS